MTRNSIITIVLAMLLSSLVIVSLHADNVDSVKENIGGIEYDLDEVAKIAKVTGCDGNIVDLVIPARVTFNGEEYTVKDIIGSFSGKPIRTLIVEEGVETIGQKAFTNCPYLGKVSLPSTITTLNRSVFENCHALSQVELKDGLITIGISSFARCASLREISIPQTVTIIDQMAFESSGISKVLFEGTPKITRLGGSGAFGAGAFNKTSLESFEVPDTVNVIPQFANCARLKELTYGSGLSGTMGAGRINNCAALEKITIEDGLSITPYSIRDCPSLKEFSISEIHPTLEVRNGIVYNNDVTEILLVPGALKGTVTLPSGLIKISDSAFSGRTLVEAVDFSNVMADTIVLGTGVFENCTFSEIDFKGKITALSQNTFKGCFNLRSVEGLEKITSIGNSCFMNCKSLDTISETGTLTTISNSAFENCVQITEFALKEGLESIGFSAFHGTSLKEVKIPSTVTTVGRSAFSECHELLTVSIASPGNPVFKDTVFENCEKLMSVPSINIEVANRYGIFNGCKSLKTFKMRNDAVPGISGVNFARSGIDTIDVIDNSNYIFENGMLLDSERKRLIFCVNSTSGKVTVPDTVTNVGPYAFSGCSDITEIVFPAGLMKIEDMAISGCSSLVNADFSLCTGAVSFDKTVFKECAVLKSLVLPMKMASNFTIRDMDAMEEITASEGFTVYSMQSLRKVTLRNGAKTIPERALSQCSSLEEIVLPSTLETIGNSAFFRCTSLKTVTMSKCVSIGDGAFMECGSLEDFVLPDNLSSIGIDSFSGCLSLKTLNLPDSVATIGTGAFNNCVSLEDVRLSDSMTSLEAWMFKGCVSLKSMHIGKSVNKVTPFDSSRNLDKITLSGENESFTLIKGVLYKLTDEKPSTLIWCPATATEIEIPETVDKVDPGALKYCFGIKNIRIKGSLVDSMDLFKWAFALENVQIDTEEGEFTTYDGMVFSMDMRTLIKCPMQKKGNIMLPDGLTTISEGAFEGCALMESVHIPDTVSQIYKQAFYGCSNLEKAILPESVTSINDGAFSLCFRLKEVKMDGVTAISEKAFRGCTALTEVSAVQLRFVGISAFEECRSLESISAPNLTEIGKMAFYGCISIKSLELPSLLKVEEAAFFGCSSLQALKISPHYVNSFAFARCTALKSVELGEGVYDMKGKVFDGCTSLQSVTLPASLRNISTKESLFEGCISLKTLKVGEGSLDFVVSDGALFSKDLSKIYWISDRQGVFNVPDYTSDILYNAAIDCYGMTGFAIGEGNKHLTEINGSVFSKDKTKLLAISAGFTGTLKIPKEFMGATEEKYQGAKSISGIEVEGGNNHYTKDGILYAISNGSSFMCFIPKNVTGKIELPSDFSMSPYHYAMADFGSVTEYVLTGSGRYATEGGIIYDAGKTVLCKSPSHIQWSIYIPDKVRVINTYAFRGYTGEISAPATAKWFMDGNPSFLIPPFPGGQESIFESLEIRDGATDAVLSSSIPRAKMLKYGVLGGSYIAETPLISDRIVCTDAESKIFGALFDSDGSTGITPTVGTLYVFRDGKYFSDTPSLPDVYVPKGETVEVSGGTDWTIDPEDIVSVEPGNGIATIKGIQSGVTVITFNDNGITKTFKVFVTVSVVFDANGGNGDVPAAIVKMVGDSVDLPNAGDLSREGFTFLGWATNKNAEKGLDAFTMGEDNVTLYAIWGPSTSGSDEQPRPGLNENTKIVMLVALAAIVSISAFAVLRK